jgi:hypothetical protein
LYSPVSIFLHEVLRFGLVSAERTSGTERAVLMGACVALPCDLLSAGLSVRTVSILRINGQRADLRRGVVLVVLATIVAFPVAVSAAIACYPGHDAAVNGYRFWHDFLSALGETRTPCGHDNFRACLIFNIALGAAMLAVIPYWHIRSDCLRGPRLLRWLAFLCCTGFSLGMAGVAAAPYNLWPHLHNTCVYTAFAVIVPGVLLLVLGSDRALVGWRYRVAWAVFAIVLLLSEWVLGNLVSQHVLPSYPVKPTLQKVNVAVFFGWLVADLWLFNAYLNRREAANT